MKTVQISLGDRSYDIRIGSGLLSDSSEFVPWVTGQQVLIVSNVVVAPLYLATLRRAISGKTVEEIILPDGENTKILDTVSTIFDRMLAVPLDRSATIIALGGGVVGDMAGFSAACYQRGIPFIQVPTTLLAQVDSSVGGKTGVNHTLGKNMIGAFYQPRRVVIDLSTLATLEPRQFSAGLAEVIKYGLINDYGFFCWLEENIEAVINQQEDALEYVVEQSCLNKAKVVEQDERESGVRALLNLGHTFGHAIETATNYSNWLHGEAVGIGMLMAMQLSLLQGWLGKEDVERARSLLERAGLRVEPSVEFSASQLKELMKLDKKVQNGNIRLVLMKAIGESFVTSDYEESALDQTLGLYAIG